MRINLKTVVIVLASMLLIGCTEKKETNTKFNPVIPVNVMTVDVSNNENFRNYIGILKSDVEIPMSFEFGGTLVGIYVHNGQTVKKGDILAKVDDVMARSLHETALATLHQAEDGYARLKKVHDEGGVSDVRWVQMLTDLEKARQTEISARKHLEDCTLYAPQDGVVSMGSYVVGREMRPTEKVCTIVSLDKMVVSFSVPEREISFVKIGDQAFAKLPSLNNEEYEVVVSDKSLIAHPMSHTYEVRAKFTSANDVVLLPGMVAKVRMAAVNTTGIVVPSSCVQTVTNGTAVWVVKDGAVKRKKITVSEFVKNGVLVSSGLEHGDVVVVEGYQKLYDGAKVSY